MSALKPAWVVEKERMRKREEKRTVWLFGLHAVRDALVNPNRKRLRLIVTPNAAARLKDAIAAAGMTPELADPRHFPAPLDPNSVHQGAALEVLPLEWGTLEDICDPKPGPRPVVVLLDRVTDPHNAGAILRSAAFFGAKAVVAPLRHAAPESGALAKAASGALERQPYLRVPNLAQAMERLRALGYVLIGLDGAAPEPLEAGLAATWDQPLGLVLGAEGEGLREKTRALCDRLACIAPAGSFGSLNVSNAAAVGLYAATRQQR